MKNNPKTKPSNSNFKNPMANPRLLLLTRLKKTIPTSLRFFSSSSALRIRPLTTDDSEDESPVYKRVLKIQKPSTIKFHEGLYNNVSLYNFVSLIGTIQLPFKECKSEKFGVHTFLMVREPGSGYGCFRILLKFWDQMAEMSIQHLKPQDLVYVSGELESYEKVDKDGKLMHHYKVNVNEVNFVAQGLGPAHENSAVLKPEVSCEERMQKRRDRLHLWQIFFANPSEWWDNRNRKKGPNSPDFSHKDTKEALWLSDKDPPWVHKQLQLQDSRLSKRSIGEHRNSLTRLSPLGYDD